MFTYFCGRKATFEEEEKKTTAVRQRKHDFARAVVANNDQESLNCV